MTAPKYKSATDKPIKNTITQINTLTNDYNDTIKHTEIQNNIKNLQNKKAPGHDNITNHMLKIAANIPHFITLLTDLFNTCLRISYFPETWKLGIVILFPKPHKPTP